MKKIWKVLALALCIVLTALSFAGCKDAKDTNSDVEVQHKYDRELYKDGLEDYVKLGDYLDLPVDTADETFQVSYYDKVIDTDVENYDLYIRQTDGTVVDGDTVNIDYVGLIDGVEFEGGSGTDYDLTIGSNTFIEGFEEGLIGKAIGTTVEVNATFPEDYGDEELNGKDVVFQVTINYVKTTVGRLPETYFGELGFESLEAYTADVTKRAVRDYLLDTAIANAEIEYPQEEKDMILKVLKKQYSAYCTKVYGVDLAGYLSALGQTEENFEKTMITESVEPMMKDQLVCYAVYDKEKLEVTDEEIQAQVDKTTEKFGATEQEVKDYYGDFYFESLAIQEKVVEYLYENAKIS